MTTPATPPKSPARHDIRNRDDIEALVVAFYTTAFADPVLGPIFTDIAQMDLAAHLPHMVDFWSVALLKEGTYGRNAFDAHLRLHRIEPLTPMHFQRWEDLWHEAVDSRFAGERANLAKLHASRMSGSIQRRLATGEPANLIRIMPPAKRP